MAKLAARLHDKMQVQWFGKYWGEIRQLCPLMKDEAGDSPLWVMMRTGALVNARLVRALSPPEAGGSRGDEVQVVQRKTFLSQKRANAPSDEDVKRIAALLPQGLVGNMLRV